MIEDADDPEQIRRLLPGSPGCLILVTSRRRMIGLPGIFSVGSTALAAQDRPGAVEELANDLDQASDHGQPFDR